MKPTQQDIVDLAREAGGGLSTVAEPLNHPWKFSQTELERFVALLLERYGAGGGEPVAWIDEFGNVYPIAARRKKSWVNAYQHNWRPLYTHPSPTDLRAEYLRGLEDAAKVCKQERIVKGGEVFAEKIEALKDKQ